MNVFSREKLFCLFLAIGSGLFSGISITAFLYALQWATNSRTTPIIWLLPIAGFFIGWFYYRFGQPVQKGVDLIIDEFHQPSAPISPLMAPFIFTGTILTHLFGGSAGRESTAVQIGSSLSDLFSRWFHISKEQRRRILIAGAGSGFSASIGTPIAGFIFGLEFTRRDRTRLFGWLECAVASFVGYYTTQILKAPHSVFPEMTQPIWNVNNFLYVVLAGLCFGFTARTFNWLKNKTERQFKSLITYPPLRPLLAGLLLVGFYHLEGTYRFAGLGIDQIQAALQFPSQLHDPLYKSIFTALTVGGGFKGGEFIPLVFVGTTLGSYLGGILPAQFDILAVTGFAAVFGAASNTPIACAIMVAELFGFHFLPFSLLGCLIASWSSGSASLYESQTGQKWSLQRLFRIK